MYVKPKKPIPSVPSSAYVLHDKAAVFDQDMIWAGSVNWSGKGMRSDGMVFAFRDPNTNIIIKTTMEENATKFISMSLEHFEVHVTCKACVKRLSEYKNKQAALALESE